MNANLVSQIRRRMEQKPTEELRAIYSQNDRSEWSDEAFEAIRQILAERDALASEGLSMATAPSMQPPVGMPAPPVPCPRCGLLNPAGAARCDCGHNFQAPAAVPVAASVTVAADERACPACAEVIKQAALKCRFCGAVLDAQLASQDVPAHIAKDIDTNARQALTYGVISIFICAPILGPTAISRGNTALRLLRQHAAYEGRSSARGKATAGVIIGWIALALFVLVLIGRFSNL